MARLIGPNEAVTIGPTETTTFQGLAVQGELTVEGRLVVEPAQVTATATDTDAGTSTTTRNRRLASTSADTDAGTSTATRERVLTTRRSLTVASGETQTITSGTVVEKDDVEVSGRLVVEGDLIVTDGLQDADSAVSPLTRERPLQSESADTDSSTALAREVRTITATAVDTDSATISLQRLRKLLTAATDSDSAQVTTKRVRDLLGSGTDADTTLAVLLPRSQFTDPRAAGIDILEQTYNWPAAKPDVKRGEAVPWKSRENTTQPRVYVTKPTSDELDRFSADGRDLTEDETVRFDIWILDGEHPDELARQYRNQIINRLYKYSNDNYSNTEFQEVQPTNSTDFRAQSSGRQTDHYIYTIEVDWHRLVTRV
jgi:hypothetical protein